MIITILINVTWVTLILFQADFPFDGVIFLWINFDLYIQLPSTVILTWLKQDGQNWHDI